MISQIAHQPPNNKICKAVRYRPARWLGSTSQSHCPQCTRCCSLVTNRNALRPAVQPSDRSDPNPANGDANGSSMTQVQSTILTAHRRVWMALSATLFFRAARCVTRPIRSNTSHDGHREAVVRSGPCVYIPY